MRVRDYIQNVNRSDNVSPDATVGDGERVVRHNGAVQVAAKKIKIPVAPQARLLSDRSLPRVHQRGRTALGLIAI